MEITLTCMMKNMLTACQGGQSSQQHQCVQGLEQLQVQYSATTWRANRSENKALILNPLPPSLQCTFFIFQADTNKLHIILCSNICFGVGTAVFPNPHFYQQSTEKYQNDNYKVLNPTTSAESTSTCQATILPLKQHCFVQETFPIQAAPQRSGQYLG